MTSAPHSTPPRIAYFADDGEIAYMDDVPVEMSEVPYSDWKPPESADQPTYSEYAVLGNSSIDECKARLLSRLTMRAKFEKASRADYAFTEGKDGKGNDVVFVLGCLSREMNLPTT